MSHVVEIPRPYPVVTSVSREIELTGLPYPKLKNDVWIVAGALPHPLAPMSALGSLRATWENDEGERFIIECPPNMPTDKASVPKAFRWVVSKTGPYDLAAYLHDFIYLEKDAEWKNAPNLRMKRSDADKVLRDVMIWSGVGWYTRSKIYSAVRVGGWTAW